jgi:hypothetical protein
MKYLPVISYCRIRISRQKNIFASSALLQKQINAGAAPEP